MLGSQKEFSMAFEYQHEQAGTTGMVVRLPAGAAVLQNAPVWIDTTGKVSPCVGAKKIFGVTLEAASGVDVVIPVQLASSGSVWLADVTGTPVVGVAYGTTASTGINLLVSDVTNCHFRCVDVASAGTGKAKVIPISNYVAATTG